jgi:hypothetical protein
VVSLRPAETTADQCVVTKADRADGSIPVEVVPGTSDSEDRLIDARVIPRAGKASGDEGFGPGLASC